LKDNMGRSTGRNTGKLAEAIVEVTRTILTNPSFFPARDLAEVKAWVKRLFPETSQERFDSHFANTVLRSDLPWGRKRFWIPPGSEGGSTPIGTEGNPQ
jgi:hypothetical protein